VRERERERRGGAHGRGGYCIRTSRSSFVACCVCVCVCGVCVCVREKERCGMRAGWGVRCMYLSLWWTRLQQHVGMNDS